MDQAVPIVIANPRAAGGKLERSWPQIEPDLRAFFPTCQVHWTDAPGNARELGRAAREAGSPQVIVAGGDGTISEVVDGMLSARSDLALPTLALLPLGTGGDLARTLGIPKKNAKLALQIAAEGEQRWMDVGRIEGIGPEARCVANIASFGLSGDVVQRVNNSKKRLGALTFAWATLRSTLAFRPTRVKLSIDEDEGRWVEVQTLAVANGRYFGGGMQIAPTARVDDGLLEVVLIGALPLTGLIRHGHRVYRGTHLDLAHVQHWRARKIEILEVEGPSPLWEVDGEAGGELRPGTCCEILPAALLVRVPAPHTGAAS